MPTNKRQDAEDDGADTRAPRIWKMTKAMRRSCHHAAPGKEDGDTHLDNAGGGSKIAKRRRRTGKPLKMRGPVRIQEHREVASKTKRR
jgi:hypothetical protein